MDQWKPDGFCQSIQPDLTVANFHPPPPSHADLYVPSNRLQISLPESSQRVDVEVKDPVVARKVQKADREKLRRDRLNEQFLELGNTLDSDRPKNDKATILGDTVQMLKDLTAQVNRLKAEYTTLTEESRELTQEKNELREEKASLKSDIDNLNGQYQQRVRVMFPWTAMDPGVMMGPPSYPFPVPVPVPAGPVPVPIPIHQSMQPYPFFNQNPGPIPNPCSTFIPYSSPANPHIEQPTAQHAYPHPQTTGRSHTSIKQDSKSKPSSDLHRGSNGERNADSNDVATELELKTPGSTTNQEISAEKKSNKHSEKESSVADRSCSSRCSSSRGVQDSSSSSVGDGPKVDS